MYRQLHMTINNAMIAGIWLLVSGNGFFFICY